MNEKFDELAKGTAQSVTRRSALKKFGAGLAGKVLVGDYILAHALQRLHGDPPLNSSVTSE